MIKLLCLSLLLFGIFAGAASGQGRWDQGSSEDWLGAGPIYSYESYYNPAYYDTMYYWDWDYNPYYINWEDYPYYWDGYPIYHSV